jgi:hypothetical protein
MTWREAGISASSRSRKAMKSHWLRVEAVIPDTSPEWTAKAANRFWVPLRTYSLSRRAGRPGSGRVSGRAGWRAAIEVFSSTETTIAFWGGST